MSPPRHLGWTARLAGVVAVGGLVAAGCGGSRAAGPHWPKSAGAITPEDPAEDGGESLDPHRVGDEAAAVEHGGDDITSILDQPAVTSTPPSGGASSAPTPAGGQISPEGVPVFEEIIIVQ